jgi:aldehyde dehydrogenase (NAD+)
VSNYNRFYIDGGWARPAGAASYDLVSPHTEEVIARVPRSTDADMDAAVAAARRAFDSGPWPRLAMAERAEAVGRLADLFAKRGAEFNKLITDQMGSPITMGQMIQVMPAQLTYQFYADLGREFTVEEERAGMLGPVLVRREPVGVVAAVVAWNVPELLISTKLAPALVAGCTLVVKPAPETPLDALLLGELLTEAGIPAGVVNVVPGGREVGEYLVSHPDVDKVSFTGSTAAGRRVGEICGRQLKRCGLELGGKSAAIILDDADLDSTVPMLKIVGLLNNGQACVAQTRILAPRSRYDEIVDALAGMVDSLVVGDPSDPATEIGPLVAKRQVERVEGYLRAGRDEGARVAAGGGRPPSDRGWYVSPTLFADVDNDMTIAREEIFGPVLSVIPYADEAEAVRIANDSEYGLAGTVWTADVDHGIEIARQVRTGTYGVNLYNIDICAPFGGYKASGVGREMGPEGLHEYLEDKAIATPMPIQNWPASA